MTDLTAWKTMYLVLSRATEKSISAMIEAHMMCEEILMAASAPGDPDREKVLTDTKRKMVEARDAVQKAREAIRAAKIAEHEEHTRY